jgi:hypothetical protein
MSKSWSCEVVNCTGNGTSGYCGACAGSTARICCEAIWVTLKAKLRASAPSLTPARVLESLSAILMIEVWFALGRGGKICLPRITQPEDESVRQ